MGDDTNSISKALVDHISEVDTTVCLSTKVIVITEDKLSLLLEDGIQKLNTRTAWIAPLGIFISCAVALTTSNFRDFGGLKGDSWQAIFVLSAIGAIIWLLFTLCKVRRFGRDQFLQSIKIAGTERNYKSPTNIPNINSPLFPDSKSYVSTARKNSYATVLSQCRQCGNVITGKSNKGKVIRCPYCGSVN